MSPKKRGDGRFKRMGGWALFQVAVERARWGKERVPLRHRNGNEEDVRLLG